MALDQDLRVWQANFTSELQQAGLPMMVKTRSHCHVTYTDKGRQRHIERWITISLTAEESQRLQHEPHLSGDVQNMTCCNGVDEHELCIHPL